MDNYCPDEIICIGLKSPLNFILAGYYIASECRSEWFLVF